MGIVIDGFTGASAMSDTDRGAWKNAMAKIPATGFFIEVGTFCGVSCASIAKQCKDVRFLCVDPFKAGVGTGPGMPEHWMHNRQPNMRLFVGTLQELNAMCPQLRADMILIDGDHGYNGCSLDLDTAKDMTDKILAHDYGRGQEPHLREVTDAVDHFCKRENWKLVNRTGYMVYLEKQK
jgi:hypothetical protein